MRAKITQNLVSAAIILFGLIAVFALSNFVARVRPSLPEGFADQDLALQGSKLKNYSLGMNGLFADWYWMQSLQYVGDKISKNPEMNINLMDLRPLNPRLLYPLLDNATSLDPQYLAAYSYGAVVLPAIDPEQAIKITRKGIENNPDRWQFYKDLGYIYWRLKDYEKAAEAYAEGAKIKNAPPFMTIMVAQMKSQGGSVETARRMYEEMYQSSQDTQTKEVAAINLLQLDSLDEREVIQPILKLFQEKTGRCPADWKEIFPLLRNIKTKTGKLLRFDSATFAPVDPTNVPYFLRQTGNLCEVVVDTKKSKIPVYQ